MMMIPQSDTAAWMQARLGCLTASRMADAMQFIKDGAKPKDGPQKYKPGAARVRYLHEVFAERLARTAVSHYVSKPMRDGTEREPDALALYEARSGDILTPAAFCQHPTIEWFGATPDSFIRNEGTVQVKCPTLPIYVEWLRAGVIPDDHQKQMTAELAVTRRRYAMFVAFQPEMPPHLQLFVRRFEASAEQIEEVEQAARAFLREVEEMVNEFDQRKAA